MAQIVHNLIVSVYFITLLYARGAKSITSSSPVIESLRVVNETVFRKSNNEVFTELLVELKGFNFYNNMKVRGTTNSLNTGCAEKAVGDKVGDELIFKEVWLNSTYSVMKVNINSEILKSANKFYICVKFVDRTVDNITQDSNNESTFPSDNVIKWVHLGEDVALRTGNEQFLNVNKPAPSTRLSREHHRHARNTDSEPVNPALRSDTCCPCVSSNSTTSPDGIELFGFRIESSDSPVHYGDDGVPQLKFGTAGILRLFGIGWTENTRFVLTTIDAQKGQPCEFPVGTVQEFVTVPNKSDHSALLQIRMPVIGLAGTTYYLCTKEVNQNGSDQPRSWTHLGNETYLQIQSYEKLLPLWLSIAISLACLAFSSLFSGLNLGLMSLDRTDLKIICNTGTEEERRFAHSILPVREHGNYLLCSILLGNVMVNSTFTILLDDLTSGLVAIIASTLAIVIFGEITPQAVCSRHGLAIGAKTIYITKVVMLLTFPLSYPISRMLDWCLGEEIGAVYTRERLKELVKLTTEFNDLEKDEVNIISGALELRKKIVRDVMTKLEDVYMLSYDTILDFETVSEIMKSGYSRVPVYEGSRHNIVTVLYTKDLALVDPDDNTPLKTLCQFYQNSCYFVFEDTTLDVLFKQFKEGIKGHMAFVHRVNNEGEGDPFYETVGLITLEDVIEELIQAEIMDETDVWNSRSKHRRNQRSVNKDFTAFAEKNENQRIHISPQLTLATFQFLSTSIEPFKPENISETILSRLLKQDIIFHIKMKNKEKAKDDPHTIIYQQGKAADYFVLILEGRVEVTCGRENLVFESGPFTYFGQQALTQNVGVAESPTSAVQPLGSLQSVNLESMLRYTFIPDYTVRAVSEVFYLKVKRSFYLAAKRATLMERCRKEESNAGDNFDDEVEKLLHSFGDEDTRSQGSPDLTRTRSQQGTPVQVSPNNNGRAVLNNGGVFTSEPVLVSPSRTPKLADSTSTDERTTLLQTAES